MTRYTKVFRKHLYARYWTAFCVIVVLSFVADVIYHLWNGIDPTPPLFDKGYWFVIAVWWTPVWIITCILITVSERRRLAREFE